jgi:signal transduction histidine kinase
MALSLNAPIEDLKLSQRVRNVLHLGGLHTVASVLKFDDRTALRRFGMGARAELASALQSHGLALPSSLEPSESDDIGGDISKLFGQIEASFQKWSSRIEHFEMRVRELTAKGSGNRRRYRHVAKVGEPAHASASAVLAQEFRTRLRALRTTSKALRNLTKLPPEQLEMMALMEEESIRLSLLVGRLIEMLRSEKEPAIGSRISAASRQRGQPGSVGRNPVHTLRR